MTFIVLPPRTEPAPMTAPGTVCLVSDKWNDYGYVTQFHVIVVDSAGGRVRLGAVKIAMFGMTDLDTPVPHQFEQLGDDYYSLGQGENYYETLNSFDEGFRLKILRGLRDVALDLERFNRAKPEAVFNTSLLRSVKADAVLGRFHRLASNNAELSAFDFAYQLPQQGSQLALRFEVQPESFPPTNVHILIGRNGVGKTHCLDRMGRALASARPEIDDGQFRFGTSSVGGQGFAGVVSVSFSAFDPFIPSSNAGRRNSCRYEYVGLKTPRSPAPGQVAGDLQAQSKTVAELTHDFVTSVVRCREGLRRIRWRDALRTLESDPGFRETDLTRLAEGDEPEVQTEARASFDRLSSGHKIVLLTVTRLVELVDERTLVLLDEPETHLHPPLLSAFVRCLSALLSKRNGVAIVATHSPVVLQEVPRSCVWVLRRHGGMTAVDRPTIETFGENVGILTNEVFGLEVTESGFHRLLEQVTTKVGSYQQVIEAFGGQLGAEARAVAQALIRRSNLSG